MLNFLVSVVVLTVEVVVVLVVAEVAGPSELEALNERVIGVEAIAVVVVVVVKKGAE